MNEYTVIHTIRFSKQQAESLKNAKTLHDMIKENDLRLNNLVKWNDSVQKITAIAFGNCLLDKNPTADYPVKITEIEPIKLTEKILLSCGFKERKSIFGYWIYEIKFHNTIFSVEEVDLGLCYFYIENTHVSQTKKRTRVTKLIFFYYWRRTCFFNN